MFYSNFYSQVESVLLGVKRGELQTMWSCITFSKPIVELLPKQLLAPSLRTYGVRWRSFQYVPVRGWPEARIRGHFVMYAGLVFHETSTSLHVRGEHTDRNRKGSREPCFSRHIPQYKHKCFNLNDSISSASMWHTRKHTLHSNIHRPIWLFCEPNGNSTCFHVL